MFLSKPMLGTQIDWSNPLNDPVLDLLFNEGHGNIVHDLSGWGNHGTLHGFDFPPTRTSGWNPGMDGACLAFDESDDYISVPNSPSLNPIGGITVDIVMKPNAWADWIWLVAKNSNMTADAGYHLARDNDLGALVFCVHGEKAQYVWSPTLGQQYRLTGVFSPNTILQLYVDGVPVGDNTGIPSSIDVCTNDLAIGKTMYYAASPYLNGSIARVRILPRAMSAFEVMQAQIDPYGVYLR